MSRIMRFLLVTFLNLAKSASVKVLTNIMSGTHLKIHTSPPSPPSSSTLISPLHQPKQGRGTSLNPQPGNSAQTSKYYYQQPDETN